MLGRLHHSGVYKVIIIDMACFFYKISKPNVAALERIKEMLKPDNLWWNWCAVIFMNHAHCISLEHLLGKVYMKSCNSSLYLDAMFNTSVKICVFFITIDSTFLWKIKVLLDQYFLWNLFFKTWFSNRHKPCCLQ